MKAIQPKCPVCDSEMHRSDIPKHDIYVCTQCEEVAQIHEDGTVIMLSDLLTRSELGDDRVRAAISKPHIVNLRSFTDVFSNVQHRLMMELSEATGAARTILSQAENRLDFAISNLTGLDIVSDKGGDVLRALREARELISPAPEKNKGIKEVSGGATN